MIAWAPKTDPAHLLQITSVYLNPRQPLPLDRVTYLSLLSGRIQQMIGRCQNPQAQTDSLIDQMVEDSLLHDPGAIRWQAAGQRLVMSNPLVLQRLNELSVLNSLKFAKPAEMQSARQVLKDDQQEPESRLLDWASALASH